MRVMSVAILALAACAYDEGRVAAPVSFEEECGAAGFQHLVGTSVTGFDFGALAGPVRVLPPGAAMTMDHRPERLNVDLDANDRITRLWCG